MKFKAGMILAEGADSWWPADGPVLVIECIEDKESYDRHGYQHIYRLLFCNEEILSLPAVYVERMFNELRENEV